MKTALALLIALVCALPASADGLPEPKGEVLLTITGDLALTNGDHAARFDEQMLHDIGGATFKTSTVWTEGTPEFTGVRLADLVAKLGITSPVLSMVAVNDYMVEVPLSDAVADGPIIAYEMEGKPMSVRDKGPLWLIYPYDSKADYQSEMIYSRSIWQLVKIDLTK
jgi:hypothetical protein